jgi:cell division control protein 7
MTNVPSVDQSPANLNDLVLKLNPHLYTPPLADPTPEEAAEHITLMDNALDLCSKLLKLDSARRIAAKDALNHNFFNDFDDIEASVERVLPILSGEDGKCGHLHSTAEGKRKSPRLAIADIKTEHISIKIVRKWPLVKESQSPVINVCHIPLSGANG